MTTENTIIKKERASYPDTSSFVAAARIKHGDKYDYSKTEFTNLRNPVTVICHAHGEPYEFSLLARAHLHNLAGCNRCANEAKSRKMLARAQGLPTEPPRVKSEPTRIRWNKNKFIEEAIRLHQGKFDYSKVEMENLEDRVILICTEHPEPFEFETKATNHIYSKSGCPKCHRTKLRQAVLDSRGITLDKFLEESRKTHGEKYDYSKVTIKGSKDLVEIICPSHGSFWQPATVHAYRSGCLKCARETRQAATRGTLEGFIEKAREEHGDKYDYSKSVYITAQTKILITCPSHGDFEQIPGDHIKGHGCSKCFGSISKPEIELAEYFKSLGENLLIQHKLTDNTSLDLFFPEKNIGIEYNGLRWHSEDFKDDQYHLRKTLAAAEQGIHLIHLFEDTWLEHKEKTLQWLNAQLGINQEKLNARDLKVERCKWKDIRGFIQDNHIQGAGAPGSYCYRLLDSEGVCRSVMSFCTNNVSEEGEIVLDRFCSNARVRGGFSKLLTAFIRDDKPEFKKISSFSDRSWSKGTVYSSNGFMVTNIQKPQYFWCKQRKRYNRRGFQKAELAKMFPDYDPEKTEVENCKNNGYSRIWDCGLLKWERKL